MKNVVIATTTISSVATPLICTSCTCSFKDEEPVLSSIDLNLSESKVVLETGQEWTSEPINVECLDQNNQPIVADLIFSLSLTNGNTPDWIQINNSDRTIHIAKRDHVALYAFDIQAYEANEGIIKSNVQQLTVEVIPPPLFEPDSIQISCDKPIQRVFTTQRANIQLDLTAYYQEYPEDLIDKECIWSIENIKGNKIADLHDNPLFTLQPTIKDCQLLISQDVDETYIDIYEITIKATSHLNPNVYDDIAITINMVDGFKYFDENRQYTYERSSLQDNWSLSLLPTNCSSINEILPEIYDIPVTKIADNLCSKSNVSKLAAVRLNDSIVEIGNSAFSNQTYLYNIVMSKVKYVGAEAFAGCYNMKLMNTYEQPSLISVGARAFYQCSSFSFADDIVHNLKTIGDEAFCGTKLTTSNLGSQIETIGIDCFSECQNLQYIKLATPNPPVLNGALYSKVTALQTIYVPANSVEIYKISKGWITYQSKIKGF